MHSIKPDAARRLFLAGHALLDPPGGRVTLARVQDVVEALGFVQMDSINAVERAHHLILHSRLEGYRPPMLASLLETRRTLFEHWTHDASAIPTSLFPHWRRRFRRDAERIKANAWWRSLLGDDGDRIAAEVLERIRQEGPVRSQDFEHAGERGPWWSWKPQKAALDYLWRTGELMIAARSGFQKVYDLTERVLPDAHAMDEPPDAEHVEWACASAAHRLGVFTPTELAAFWRAVEPADARAWCERAVKRGDVVPATLLERPGYALAEVEVPEAGDEMRLLCPFDPVVRDRARCERLFGFRYRFEAFVPAAQRQYGYYVMPILEGDRLVGRLDPKTHRADARLEVRGLWWEPGVRTTKARLRRLSGALERLAAFVGARRVDGPLKQP